jgi:hypothetical protein
MRKTNAMTPHCNLDFPGQVQLPWMGRGLGPIDQSSDAIPVLGRHLAQRPSSRMPQLNQALSNDGPVRFMTRICRKFESVGAFDEVTIGQPRMSHAFYQSMLLANLLRGIPDSTIQVRCVNKLPQVGQKFMANSIASIVQATIRGIGAIRVRMMFEILQNGFPRNREEGVHQMDAHRDFSNRCDRPQT